VNDPEQILLLTEIRDLQRQLVELTQQTIKNQETALGNQQQAMQPMVVARLLGAPDFLLNGNPHHIGILDLQFPHRRLRQGTRR